MYTLGPTLTQKSTHGHLHIEVGIGTMVAEQKLSPTDFIHAGMWARVNLWCQIVNFVGVMEALSKVLTN